MWGVVFECCGDQCPAAQSPTASHARPSQADTSPPPCLVRADDLPAALELLHPRVVQDAPVDAVEALDLPRLGGNETLPRERWHLPAVVPPESHRIVKLRLQGFRF